MARNSDVELGPGAASRRLATDYSSTAEQYAALWGPVILPMGLSLLGAMPLESSTHVLDVGAGVGGLIPHIRAHAPRAVICGVDYSEGMLRRARVAEPSFPCAVMDAQELGIRSGVFDAV